MLRYLLLLLSLSLVACSESPTGDAPVAGDESAFQEIEWADLMPADYDPAKALPDQDLSDLDDADPDAQRYLEALREAWRYAPVVDALDGRQVRIPGFVVPVEYDETNVREFLLVPYFGACVHVPPPPANQLIHVIPDKPVADGLNMMPVWVSGVLAVQRLESDLGNAGYQLA